METRFMRTRTGLVVLTLTGLLVTTGCGSRASDAQIAEAIHRTVATNSPPAGGAAPAAEVTAPVADRAVAATASSTPRAATATPADTAPREQGRSANSSQAARPAEQAAPVIAANLSTIKIGQVGTFSGVIGAVAAPGTKTVAAWVAYTNAHGGLNGHPVKLIVGDDQGDPSSTMTLTKRMVETDGILAMVGNINAFAFVPVEKYTREKGIPLIGGDGMDPGWATSPNAFPVMQTQVAQAMKGLEAAVKAGTEKIGIIYCVEASSLCSYYVQEAKKSAVGSHVTQDYQVSMVAPSYTGQCLRLRNGGVDLLWVLLDGAGVARVIRDCAAQNYRPKIFVMSLNVTADVVKDRNLAGALVPGGTFVPTVTGVPAIEKYRQVMSTYAPTVGIAGVTSFSWAGAELLGLVGRNLSANPTSAELYEALWKVRNETLGGLTVPLTFPKGKPPQIQNCYFLWAIKDGQFAAPNGARPTC
jgi:branched-chain amino acid transport system substrate-binding protein